MILNLDRVTPFCREYQGIGSRGAGSREQGCSELPITNYPLPITHYQLPITNYPLPSPTDMTGVLADTM